MSQTQAPKYKPGTGSDRYARFCEDVLGFDRTRVFDQIAESLESNRQTLVIGGNGLGKSYGASGLALAALYCNYQTVVPVTAGNGDTVKNSIWKNVLSLWRNSGLFGDDNQSDRSIKTEIDPKWYLECHSPKNPEDLEGDHNANVIYIIEEAEKPGVTKQHIDSARSTLAEDDHILVLCNPPTDETNVVKTLESRDSWNVLRFPTWESRNALADRGLTDKPKIDGLSGVGKMQDDWREYHDEPWPGIDKAIEISSPYLDENGNPTVREYDSIAENPEFREDLHSKWYKRRVGISPPDDSESWRPFKIADVNAAWRRETDSPHEATTAGVDVARSGDETVLSGKHRDAIRTHYARKGSNHVEQKNALSDKLYGIGGPQVAVDAVGEGSGIADELNQQFNVTRFSNGAKPVDESNYYDSWAEALALFGEFLESGSIESETLYEQAKVAASVVEFSTRTLTSRGGEVIEATSKEMIQDALGHSPDHFDAALMANWLDMTGGKEKTVTRRKARVNMNKRRS
jgi:hypothetical protein